MKNKTALSIFAAITLTFVPLSASVYAKPVYSPMPKQISSAECISSTAFMLRYCTYNPFSYLCSLVCR
jgi:hypothetical protein